MPRISVFAMVMGLVPLLACGPETSFLLAPEGVDYVGALFVTEKSTTGSELLSVDRAELEVPSKASAFVYGFSAATLARVLGTAPTESTITGALRPSVACEPRLPAAHWIEVQDFEGGPALEASEAPRITAGWVEARCPSVEVDSEPLAFPSPIKSVAVDVRCALLRCEVAASDCSFEARFDTCLPQADHWSGSVDADGALCVEPSESCSEGPALAGVEQSFTCPVPDTGEPCRVDLLGPTAPLPAELAVVDVHPDRSPLPPIEAYGIATFGRGLVWAFAGLEDRVVVASPGAGDEGYSSWACAAANPSVLSFIDSAQVTVVQTATAPSCLTDLVATPDRRTFIAVYGQWPEVYIARFDRTGREQTRRRLRDLPTPPPNIAYGAYKVVASQNGRIAVLLRDQSSSSDTFDPRTEFLLVLRSNFELDEVSAGLNRQFVGLAFADENTLVTMDDRDSSVQWWALPGVRPVGRGPISNVNASSTVIHLEPIGPREVLLGATGQFGRFGRVGLELSGELTIRTWPWSNAEVTTSTPWPGEAGWHLTALRPKQFGGRETLGLSAVGLFSADEDRFLSIASLVGEHGIASHSFLDDRGDVWLLYPWTGRVMRVRPTGTR